MIHALRGAVPVLALALAAGLELVSLQGANDASAQSHDEYVAGEPGDPSRAARVVEISITDNDGDLAYMPNSIAVKKGEQIDFVLRNAGALDHEFKLDSPENNAKHKTEMGKNPEMEHDDANAKRLAPGQSDHLIWKFSKGGTFEFACLIPGHYEVGMHGVIKVE